MVPSRDTEPSAIGAQSAPTTSNERRQPSEERRGLSEGVNEWLTTRYTFGDEDSMEAKINAAHDLIRRLVAELERG